MNEHEFKEVEEIDIYYPEHEKRAETPLFRKTKHHLIKELDTPCWICGSKDKREVHHNWIEEAYANAVDWSEGSKIREDFPNFDWKNFKEPLDFVDHEVNMLVLCEIHHRAHGKGIHHVPRPIWIIQRYMNKDFIYSPEDLKQCHETLSKEEEKK